MQRGKVIGANSCRVRIGKVQESDTSGEWEVRVIVEKQCRNYLGLNLLGR